MIIRLYILVILCMSFAANAQQQQGIQFRQDLTWTQVKALAKKQNKFIFLDCYATWCGPCKLMDKEVYNQSEVGKQVNANFISVKVQIDKTSHDERNIKKWYGDAELIKEMYQVTSVPTYLFFSPEGKIVHRASGAIRDTDFLHLCSNAINPNKQYYTVLESYRSGKKEFKNMPFLIRTAKSLKDYKTASDIANDYFNGFLYKCSDKEIITKDNLELIYSFLKKSNERGFSVYYNNRRIIDSIMEIKGYANTKLDQIITSEDIDPKLRQDDKSVTKNVDWTEIFQTIARKYDSSFAERNIINSKIIWYNEKKEWDEQARCIFSKIDKYGLDTAGIGKTFLNNTMWEVVFQHCTDTSNLKRAISLMRIILIAKPNDPEYIDTYANLLYKLGNVSEAIAIEEKAIKLAPEDNDLHDRLLKMRKGVQTWGGDGKDLCLFA